MSRSRPPQSPARTSESKDHKQWVLDSAQRGSRLNCGHFLCGRTALQTERQGGILGNCLMCLQFCLVAMRGSISFSVNRSAQTADLLVMRINEAPHKRRLAHAKTGRGLNDSESVDLTFDEAEWRQEPVRATCNCWSRGFGEHVGRFFRPFSSLQVKHLVNRFHAALPSIEGVKRESQVTTVSSVGAGPSCHRAAR